MRYCLQCGTLLVNKRQDAKFCSANCRVKHNRRKGNTDKSLHINYPLLHYFGGKWRIADWIIDHMPDHKIYVEPFGGVASVLLKKDRSPAEIYNDLDNELVNLMLVVRNPDTFHQLEHRLKHTFFARSEYELALQPSENPIEQAARTIVRGYFSFGSNGFHRATGFRTNVKDTGQPAKTWAEFIKTIDHIRQRLTGVHIECRDAKDVIAGHDTPDTLFYLDPPYVADTRGNRNTYTHEMTDNDHKQLADTLHTVKGMVILSGYASTLYNDLYEDWQTVTLDTRTESGKEVTEMLWLNEATSNNLEDEKQLTLWVGKSQLI